MSLKGFHIVFITVSTLLFGFLILWSFLLVGEADYASRAMRVSGIVGILLMPVYGVYFLKKAKRIEL